MKDQKIYDQAQLTFQRLRPQPGDVVAVSFPDDIVHEQMTKMADIFQTFAKEYDITVICLRQGITLQHVPEHRMNELGWFKFDPQKPQ